MPSIQPPFRPFSSSRLAGHLLSAAVAILLLAMGAAQAAGIYQWKDAEGNIHYGDSPPPGVAMPSSPSYLLEGGADAGSDTRQEALVQRFVEACRDGAENPGCRQLRREASRELQKDCASEMTAESCIEASDKEATELAEYVASLDPEADAARRGVEEARITEMKAGECTRQRSQLEALRKMQQGLSSDMLGVNERSHLPAEIERLEARLATDCG